MKYDLVIPTRDSGAFVGVFLKAYRKLGIEPLYIVDARSVDDTRDVLRALGARVLSYEPFADFAEAGMIEFAAKAACADWIWRLDDDEFPSQALVDWVERAEVLAPVVAACRREVHYHEGRHVYSRWPTRLKDHDQNAVDYQYRIFRRDAVRYLHQVHTPGFEVPPASLHIPGDIFMIHLNCILRDVAFRLSKVRTYARHDADLSWSIIDESLPEYLDGRLQDYRDDGLAEFSNLFASLKPPQAPVSLPPLTADEQVRVARHLERSRELSLARRKAARRLALQRSFDRVPKPVVREIAKFVASIAGHTGLPSIRAFGDSLWNYAYAPVAPTAPVAPVPPAAPPPDTQFCAEKQPPRFLFLSINKRCNLRCEHCVFWHDDDDDRAAYLSRDGRRRVLGELSELNPQASVVICGGESMLDLDDYFDVSRECRSLGLTCISVVNGTRIRSPEMAERMIEQGPHEISISLNSHRADLHDRTRGVPGAFVKAVKALTLLRDARERLGGESKIYVMALVFAENYRELPEFYDFVLNDLRVDKLKLNFLQPSFGGAEEDRFFAEQSGVDADELAEIISGCDRRFSLGLNPIWQRQVHMYFTSLAGARNLEKGWDSGFETRQHICNTYERNIMVDHYGEARLCFAADFRGEKLEKAGDLRRFWTGADDVRRQMRACNRPCGISHSVRNSSSTLAARRLTQPYAPRSDANPRRVRVTEPS
jgi:MoaA/NifB/PqqE/SkfB family radical SAM enzyme